MEYEPNNQLKSNYLQEIIASQEKIEHFNTYFVKEEHDKIWSRIKSYIKDYSEKENCSMIFGSETVSDVLYYNPEIDITQDLLKYINKRYEGFN
jgi:outer membrane protein